MSLVNHSVLTGNAEVPLDTDPRLVANSDLLVASQKATKAYADALALSAGAVISVAGRAGAVELAKADVGLSNVANAEQVPLTYLDTDTALGANSDTKVPSQKATRAYVDAKSGGTRIYENVTQANSFVAKIAVFKNDATWAPAKADAIATARVDGVVESANSSTFVVVTSGTLTATGFEPNTQYYLSDSSAGALVATPPTATGSFVVPVLRAGSSGDAFVGPQEPLSLALIQPSDINLNTDASMSANSDVLVSSQKAVKTYVDAKTTALTPGTSVLWRHADIGNLPASWMPLDGTNGLPTVSALGSGANQMDYVIVGSGTVATPTIRPATGTYSGSQDVTLASATSGSAIHYTTNGSTPTRSDTTYTTTFAVTTTTTVKALAVHDLYKDSSVGAETLTIGEVGYEFKETFEGANTDSQSVAGYDNTGWTSDNASNNPQFTPSIDGSAHSLLPIAGVMHAVVTPAATEHFHFRFKITGIFPSGQTDLFMIRDADTVPVCILGAFLNSYLIVFDPTSSASSYVDLPFSAGVLYYVWVDYTAGDGGNTGSAAHVYYSTTPTKPGTTPLRYTNGNPGCGIGRDFRFIGNADLIAFDYVIADGTKVIGSNP